MPVESGLETIPLLNKPSVYSWQFYNVFESLPSAV